MIKIELEGFENLSDLPPFLRLLVQIGVRLAGQAYTESVIEYVEKEKPWTPRTGNLLQTVHWFEIGDFSVKVVGEGEEIKYGWFLEFGTKGPYVIKPKRRKALKIPTERGYIFRKKAIHPGIKPRHWFFLEIHEQKAKEAFRKTIKEGIENG